jgi:serine/threonine protein kinase
MEDTRRVCSKCGKTYAPDVIFCPKDGTPLGTSKTEVAEDPYIGVDVAGQFRIEQLVGIGAMGRVYRAHQKGIERQVAIKVLHRELLRNQTVIGRFHREAKVASRLTHPNVVQVLMTGQLDANSGDVGGEAYLVMEYLDGISLRSALGASGGALPMPRALHIILQVCDAVGEAHDQGIVHRDLKPENVMLVRRGDDKDFVKVLDFGVARIDWADSTVATQAGAIFGTARYISPEGAQGETVGPPSDVYAITTMLFQCLSGATPFDGESPVAILVKQTSEPAPDVRDIARSSYVPDPVAQVIAENLVKDPAARCADARTLGRALVEASRTSGLSPDDLVVRSTLLSSPGGALQLQSMQPTKAMKLTPELSARLEAPEGSAGQTELLEPTASDEDAPGRVGATGAAPPERAAPPSEPGVPDDQPDEGAARPSQVEPTIADEPADEVKRASLSSVSAIEADGSGPRPAFASRPSGTHEVSRPSLDEVDWTPPARSVAANTRRLLAVVLCFLLGVGLAIAAALHLGVFESGQNEPEWYAERAEAALAASAWVEPPGENLRELTDTALNRWPAEPSIVEVRARASATLLQDAERVRSRDPVESLRLARLAAEFDPDNEPARALVHALETPTKVVKDLPAKADGGPPQAESARPAPKRHRSRAKHKAAGKRPRRPTKRGSPTTADAGSPSPPPRPPTPEGRWL